MTRIRKANSTWNKPFKAPAKDPNEVTSTYAGSGTQGLATCPECGATVALRQADYHHDPNGMGIVIGSHRIGGGRWLFARGDVKCLGTGMKP